MSARPTALKNAGQAAHYHAKDDYYFRDKSPSMWAGRAAELLGLSGSVDPEIFRQLLHGRIPLSLLNKEQHDERQTDYRSYGPQPHPFANQSLAGHGMRNLSECNLAQDGERENPGLLSRNARPGGSGPDALRRQPDGGLATKEEFLKIHRGGRRQRPGVDITFSAPKTVSIMALIAGDRRLIEAHEKAVQAALDFAEQAAGCRVTENKVTREVVTGNYLFAKFNHSLSRELDSQLHTHALALNLTYNEATGKWHAIDNAPLFADQMLISSIYHAELARLCRELGYDLRPGAGTNGEMELALLDEKFVEEFSRRSDQIDAELAKQGLTRETATAAQRDAAALKTRQAKQDEVDRGALHADWRKRFDAIAKELGVEVRIPESGEGSGGSVDNPQNAREGIESGIRHFSERTSIFAEKDLVRWALAKGEGRYTLQDVKKELDRLKADGTVLAGEIKRELTPGSAAAAAAFDGAKATPEMLRYAAKIAEEAGIEPPAGESFADVRKWLDEHSPTQLGLEESRAKAGAKSDESRTRPGDTVLTTKAAQDLERVMLSRVRAGKGLMAGILAPQVARDRLAQRNNELKRAAFDAARKAGKSEAEAVALAAKTGLNAGQQAAAEMILSTRDQVVCVQGVAGAGKTFMLDQVVKEALIAEAEASGIKVVGLAPSHQAKNELKAVTGEGNTLQKFLTSPKTWQDYGPQHLFVIDEAGMASTRQMSELLRIAEQQKFKVVLVGDTRQHKAVDAGNPLIQIQTVAETARMDVSVRHKDADLAAAAALAADNKMADALAKLDSSVTEIKDKAGRATAIADRYVAVVDEARRRALATGGNEEAVAAATEKARRETLVLTGTNEARREINSAIRERLGLAGKGVEIDTLIGKDTTAESRRYLNTYKPGDVLQFAKKYKSLGVNAGDRLSVVDVLADRLIVTDATGRKIDLHPARFDTNQWGVFERDRIELSAGDRVRLRETDQAQGYVNGDWGRVVKIDDNHVTIVSDRDPRITWQIEHGSRALQIDHGYAMTGHGAQGATVDCVLADFDTLSRTLTREAAYVIITRARWVVEIFANDKKDLARAISLQADKPNALDLDRLTGKEMPAAPAAAARTLVNESPDLGR